MIVIVSWEPLYVSTTVTFSYSSRPQAENAPDWAIMRFSSSPRMESGTSSARNARIFCFCSSVFHFVLVISGGIESGTCSLHADCRLHSRRPDRTLAEYGTLPGEAGLRI